MSVDFVLDDFTSSVTMGTSASLASSAIPTLTTDATAVLEIDLAEMKNIFKFQTDSDDVLNTDASDLRYYVDLVGGTWPTLNAANAMMDASESVSPIATTGVGGSTLASNKMMVAHDFTRYLALKLFSTHFGVDLFNNEKELLVNLRSLCGSASVGNTWKDIVDSLTEISTTGDHTNITTVADGDNYMTNSDSSNTNICRVLFEQITQTQPSRFASITGSSSPQSLPFLADDSLSFKLTINPATNQNDLTGVATIPARSYRVKMVMKASPSNTETDADEA